MAGRIEFGIWNDVNFQAFSSHYCRLSARLQIMWMKIVHDQLPMGERRLKQASVPDKSLSIRPCCRHAMETVAHIFQQCTHNSQHGNHMSLAIEVSNLQLRHTPGSLSAMGGHVTLAVPWRRCSVPPAIG
jgi:hypothetical protein